MKIKYTYNNENEETELKQSYRALMIFENITNKSLELKTTTDIIYYFYSVVVASSKHYDYLFDDFMDWLDNNQEKLNEFVNWNVEIMEQQNKLSPENKEKNKGKKSKN